MSVDPAYRHHAKRAEPADLLAIGASAFKWYQIARVDDPIAPELTAEARAFVAAQGEGEGAGSLALDGDDGFVILHRCGAAFYFLLVSVWRGSNELWEAVYYRDADMTGFAPFEPAYPAEGRLRPTFCVWELGVVAHEAKVRARYLSSPRDDNDRAAWRDARYEGEV